MQLQGCRKAGPGCPVWLLCGSLRPEDCQNQSWDAEDYNNRALTFTLLLCSPLSPRSHVFFSTAMTEWKDCVCVKRVCVYVCMYACVCVMTERDGAALYPDCREVAAETMPSGTTEVTLIVLLIMDCLAARETFHKPFSLCIALFTFSYSYSLSLSLSLSFCFCGFFLKG